MPYPKEIIRQLLRCIDLTSLDSNDNENSIQKLIDQANSGCLGAYPAAVCIYPNLGNFVRKNLNPDIKTAVVAGCFPTGQTLSHVKVKEAEVIHSLNVDEVDIVINRGDALAGRFEEILTEIQAIRQALPSKCLKVILETGDLKDPELIRKTSEIAIQSGADFIKTSTGKSTIGATENAVRIMCQAIKDHYEKTGKKIGIKPSGGIKTIPDALLYWELVKEINGEAWLNPDLFRIGASSLYDHLVKELSDETHS